MNDRNLTPEQEAEKVITEYGLTTAAYKAIETLLNVMGPLGHPVEYRFANLVLTRLESKVARSAAAKA